MAETKTTLEWLDEDETGAELTRLTLENHRLKNEILGLKSQLSQPSPEDSLFRSQMYYMADWLNRIMEAQQKRRNHGG